MADLEKYKELNATQEVWLAKAKSTTREQIHAAVALMQEMDLQVNDVLLAAVIQAFSTNYLAAVNSSKG